MSRHRCSEKRNCFFTGAIILAFLLTCNSLYSQVTVQIKDTIIRRGQITNVPLIGSINNAELNSLQITLQFNALLIDIIGVEGKASYSIKCPNPDTNYNLIPYENSILTINCNDLQSVNNGTICNLKIEGLAGPDSITQLIPLEVKINGIVESNAVLKSGSFIIPGQPVIQRFPEGIGDNYPNPFFEETVFPLSIFRETKVNFKIFANDGRFILSNEKPNGMMKLSFFKNKTEEIPIENLQSKLKQGNYILKLLPDPMQFASGEYYLIMMTEAGVYHKNFIYLK